MRFQETKHIKDILASMTIATDSANRGESSRLEESQEVRQSDLSIRKPELSRNFFEKAQAS